MALVTTSQVKEYLQITTTTSDSLIALYTDLVSAEVEAYCGRDLEQAYYTGEVIDFEYSLFDGNPNITPLSTRGTLQQILLKNTPVATASVSLAYDGTVITASDYNVNQNTGIVTFYEPKSDYRNKLTASYTAGYTATTGSALSTPNDLRLVLYDGIKRLYESNTAAVSGAGDVVSKRIKDFSVTYTDGAKSSVVALNTNPSNSTTGLIKAYLAANSFILERYKRISL